MNKTCYIAGPMRGYPRFNFAAFYEAEEALSAMGYKTINPARMDEENGFDPDRDVVTPEMSQAFFNRDVEAIKKCTTIVLLPGWEKSVGANAEMHIGRWLGKELLLYPALHTLVVARGEIINPHEDILEEALRITKGDRNNAYGPPTQDFSKTARMWEVILGTTVSAKQVALCMIALKISRATWANKRDNWTDMAGYARCGFLCEEGAKQ